MKNKTDAKFASQGQRQSTMSYVDGMIPHTVAYAEDVNYFGYLIDDDLYSVCKEVLNLLAEYGVAPDANDFTQLVTTIKSKMAGSHLLTGIDYDSYTTAPTQNGNSISFPAFSVNFCTKGYYGDKLSDFTKVSVDAQTISASSSDATGVWYIYVTNHGVITKSQTAPTGDESASKCLLGSVYVINPSGFQANSWKFTPWLQVTCVETRESPTAETKGGYLYPTSGTNMSMGPLDIKMEGINFDANTQKPNVLHLNEVQAFTYKFLYKGYNPSASALTALDTTHIYNLTDASWESLNVATYGDKYMVMVPCIAPTGQTLMIPAMSTKTGAVYDSLFDSASEAASAVYGLKYVYNDHDGLEQTASRAIYLGFSLVVKVGATDLTDPNNFAIVGMVPQALAGFTNAGGQTGGGTGSYIPMPEIVHPASTAVTLVNNASNVITGNSTALTLTLPSATAGIVNQLQVKYVPGVSDVQPVFNTVTWWDDVPVFVSGKEYLVIIEYINGGWKAGYIGG